MTPEEKLAQSQTAAQTLKDASTGPTSTKGLGVGTQDPTDLGYNGREDDVGTIAGQMMGEDSRLMQKASAQGVMAANRRGLGNSSLAAGASQSAMLDQIVPMAGQTAGQQFQKNRDGAQFGMEQNLQNDRQQFESGEAEKERQLKTRLTTMGLNADMQRGAETMMNNAFKDFELSQQSILNNEKLPAAERNKLLENSKRMLQQKLDYVQGLYSAQFDWPANPFKGSYSGALGGSAAKAALTGGAKALTGSTSRPAASTPSTSSLSSKNDDSSRAREQRERNRNGGDDSGYHKKVADRKRREKRNSSHNGLY